MRIPPGRRRLAYGPRTEGAPLTGLPWRATQSEADEAPVSARRVRGLVSSREKLRLCGGNAPDGVGELRMADRVCLLRVLARRAPGGPPKAEPGATPGRGAAQRSRLDFLRTAQFGNARPTCMSLTRLRRSAASRIARSRAPTPDGRALGGTSTS